MRWNSPLSLASSRVSLRWTKLTSMSKKRTPLAWSFSMALAVFEPGRR
jgi:hypothetical protein